MAIDLRAYPRKLFTTAQRDALDRQKVADDDTVYALVYRGVFERPLRLVRYDLALDVFPLRGREGVMFIARGPGSVIPFPRIERAPVPIEVAAQIALDGWAA